MVLEQEGARTGIGYTVLVGTGWPSSPDMLSENHLFPVGVCGMFDVPQRVFVRIVTRI
jgi:hypothetical protein